MYKSKYKEKHKALRAVIDTSPVVDLGIRKLAEDILVERGGFANWNPQNTSSAAAAAFTVCSHAYSSGYIEED